MATTMVAFDLPPFYKANRSPQEWDAKYENLFKSGATLLTAERLYESAVLTDSVMSKTDPDGHYQAKLHEYAELLKHTCHLQYEVCLRSTTFIMSKDFSAKWVKAPVAVREKHALCGIAGACGIAQDLNEARVFCSKELRVSYLSSEGCTLLNLINSLALDDITRIPTKAKIISNPEWDRVRAVHQDIKDDRKKLALDYTLLLRTKLITYAIDIVMHSFLGLAAPKINILKKSYRPGKGASGDGLDPAVKKLLRATHGKEGYKALKNEAREARKEFSTQITCACHECGLQAENRTAFSKCSACSKVGREILYCSKQCQVSNWKTGHKLICGKPLDFDTASTLPENTGRNQPLLPSLPSTTNGFQRPMELLAQMCALQEYPGFDYAVKRSVYTNNEHTALMRYLGHPRIQFLAHRDKAMKTGDRQSVAQICDYILWDIETRKAMDFRKEEVIEQISREYAFPVTDLTVALKELGEIRSLFPNRPPALLILEHLDWSSM